MDAARFDTLVRLLAVPAIRRVVLRGVLAGSLLGLLDLVSGIQESRADQDHGCTNRQDEAASPATPAASPAPDCAPGLVRCGSACVDLSSDQDHCGACGAVCESMLVPVACRNGVCERANCPAGIAYCGAADGCHDLSSDPAHCGACQSACPSGVCSNGACSSG